MIVKLTIILIVIISFIYNNVIFGKTFRSNCSVISALDLVGDKWMFVVIKIMLLEQKKTFKEFSESDESIAPSILSNRLKALEKIGFIIKVKLPDNQKTNYYFLIEKGAFINTNYNGVGFVEPLQY